MLVDSYWNFSSCEECRVAGCGALRPARAPRAIFRDSELAELRAAPGSAAGPGARLLPRIDPRRHSYDPACPNGGFTTAIATAIPTTGTVIQATPLRGPEAPLAPRCSLARN